MEDTRCKVVAIEMDDFWCRSPLSGVVLEIEDLRCKSLVDRVVLEIEDPRGNFVTIKIEDPRFKSLLMTW